MAKKIRFPLKMKNGSEVRTLDELKENFDLESILGYFTDGKLAKWLSDRYYDEKAEAVAALSADTPNLKTKLCEILEVEYQAEEDDTDMVLISIRKEKLRILSAATDNSEILDNVDLVAMSQDELYDILDEGSDKVYLYGEKFEIPFGKKNVSCFGVNEPLVIIDKSKYAEDFKDVGINFMNVKFEEGAYQKNHGYPDPVGEFEIKNGVVIKCKADSNGMCIIPYGVTKIGESAGFCDKNIIKLVIPETVSTICCDAFNGCQNLISLTMFKGVAEISYNAFYGCQNLTNFTIPDSVNSIYEYAFACCDSLTSIIIPSSVSYLGGAFENCFSLASVTIMSSYTECDWQSVFTGCYNLNDVKFST